MSQTRRTAGASVLRTSQALAPRARSGGSRRPSRCRRAGRAWRRCRRPPGRPPAVNTIGTLFVASCAAWVAASWLVKIRSTPALTRASAAAGIASSLPSVKRMSNVTSRPSSKPSSLSPALSPSTVGWLAAHAALRTPMRNGRRASCASAASGEAAQRSDRHGEPRSQRGAARHASVARHAATN